MNRNDHANILGSYLRRLTVLELAKITEAACSCLHEQLNGNINSQLAADRAFNRLVEDHVDHLLEYDTEQLSIIVEHAGKYC